LTDDFADAFRRLPTDVQDQARRCYRLWRDNPFHPSLKFKRIHGHDRVYSVRIGLGWRAVGLVDGPQFSWFWIGSHAEYVRLIR
jgi:hypothetical protein